MSFSTNDFASGIQPQLSSYLHGTNHFPKNYAPQQTPAYPLLHPAAVAAMAAAAAGYSQFGSRLTNGPLNLTSVPGYRSAYNFNDSDENRASYYQHFGGLQNSANQYASAYANGFANSSKFQFPHASSSSAFQSPQSESHHSFMGSTHPSGGQVGSHMGTPPIQRTPKSQGHKTAYKSKIKKAINSQEMANRKREDFEELVKARTDKLLSSYTPPTSENMSTIPGCSGPVLNTPSVSNESPDSPNYKKLIEAVLDAKKSALLRSPSVIAYLETQQRSLAEFKRRTEMFCVDAK